jgi:hypothetical protein
MNELLVVFYVLAVLAIAYLWVYPKYAGKDVKKMAWLDAGFMVITMGISALLFWESDPSFTFIFFETNWFWFTLLTVTVLEIPLFYGYIQARGLGREYWAMMGFNSQKSSDAGWASASVKSVEKQLNDTQWDGLRTRGAKIFLLISSNLLFLLGTIFLVLVEDNDWVSLSLIYILLIGVFWFLLRKSVRLVADAPQEALDERLIGVRDRSYVIAYRWFTSLAVVLVSLLVGFTIFADSRNLSDGFEYTLNLTWTQILSIFWLVIGYSAMLPSMAVISLELSRTRK